MNDRFLELPGPRRRAMVNAGFEVFSRYPYAKAPMSEVAAAGNVSKSLLFHYFGNKLGLYLYLWDTAVERISRSTQESGALEANDLFEALWRATEAKCRVMRTHPLLFAFATRAYYEEHPDVRAAISPRVGAALVSAEAAVARLEDRGLCDGVSARDVYADFVLLSEGYMAQRYRAGGIDVDEIEHDFAVVIDRWRSALAEEDSL